MSHAPAKRMIVAGLLVPPLVYPCLTGILWLLDASVGDQTVLHHYLYESRWHLMNQILGDWGHALPSLYGIVILLWLSAFYGLGSLGLRRTWLMAVVGAVSGTCLAWLLAGTPGSSAAAALAMTGALTGWLLNTITSIGSAPRVA